MNIIEILDTMEDLLEDAWTVPLSGGKSVVDVERMVGLLADVRLNLPQEIKQARLIVTDRQTILDDAKKESDAIICQAEERAARILDESTIMTEAKQQAQRLVGEAQMQSRELKRGANDFLNDLLQETEEALASSLTQVQQAKKALRTPKNRT